MTTATTTLTPPVIFRSPNGRPYAILRLWNTVTGDTAAVPVPVDEHGTPCWSGADAGFVDAVEGLVDPAVDWYLDAALPRIRRELAQTGGFGDTCLALRGELQRIAAVPA